MMYGAPDVWDALMTKIAGISSAYLRVQVEAGASAVQLFYSWGGATPPQDYPRVGIALFALLLGGGGGGWGAGVHLGGGGRPAAGGDGRGGGRRGRGRLAGPARRRRTPRGRTSRPGQPRPVAGLRAHRGDARPRGAGDRGRAGGPGPRLQPRSRRTSVDRPRRAGPAHGLRAQPQRPGALGRRSLKGCRHVATPHGL